MGVSSFWKFDTAREGRYSMVACKSNGTRAGVLRGDERDLSNGEGTESPMRQEDVAEELVSRGGESKWPGKQSALLGVQPTCPWQQEAAG